VANLVGSLAVLLSTLFGGFLLSRKQMPPLVGWVARLSFVRCFAVPGCRPLSSRSTRPCPGPAPKVSHFLYQAYVQLMDVAKSAAAWHP